MKPTQAESPTVLPGDGLVPLESVLCTEELNLRPSRPPDYEKENRVLGALAQALADSPSTILQKMAEIMLETFRADSSGFSVLTKDDGGKRFYWPAIAGVWKPHIGGGTPRDFGPCGDVLDRNAPLLFRHFERRYTYFLPVTPPVEECLLVPFYVEGKAIGTIWVIAHDDRRAFDAEDLRQLVSLGRFASSAYQAVEFHEKMLAINEALMLGSLRQHELAEAADSLNVQLQREITERKQAQEASREAGERFRFMAESMPQKIFTAKPNGDVDYFNPSWTEFTGLTFESIRDWGWTQLIHPDDVAGNVRIWQHSIDTGEPFRFEHRFRGANGEYRWHISQAVALKDAAGKVVMWIGSNTDVQEVKEADRRKDEFLALLAHELRNPLAPIRNMLEIVKRADGNGDLIEQARSTIERQLGQMTRLIDDLLDVSRISRGTLDLRREQVELASVVHHAVEACLPSMDTAGHELTVTLPPQPVYLHADPMRLAQAVENLLSNACKYTDKGGRIGLTVERAGVEAVIRVRDTGIGIAAGELPRIFDMFMQVDSSLERSVSGLGIGLTLVKNLVEAHGGTVAVHSDGVGQGSEFVMRLPILVEALQPLARKPTVSEPAATTARRILVVDDNRDAATSLATLLKLTGNETQTAYDGLEAVDAAATFRPDVILLDIGLPKLNGYDAARRIREQPWGKGMVLVAVTGWGQDEDKQKSREAGFNGHLVKPVDHAALMQLLAELQPKPV